MTTSAGKFAAPTFVTSGQDDALRFPEVTEDEARAMLCCGPSGCGSWDRDAGGRMCAASGCMAWRWGRDLLERTPSMKVAPLAAGPGASLEQYPIVHFGNQVYSHPYPIALDFRPEGEGWEIEWSSGSANLFYWSRLKARRGYCALATGPANGGTK